jgi:hypothetical protein
MELFFLVIATNRQRNDRIHPLSDVSSTPPYSL